MVPMEWFHDGFVWSPRARGGETLTELRVLGWVLCCEAAAPKFLWWWWWGQGCDLQIHVGERLT